MTSTFETGVVTKTLMQISVIVPVYNQETAISILL